MALETNRKKQIVFLFSDTGGGHRSSANAIIEAVELEFPGLYQCKMVDILRDYAPIPFDHGPEIYPRMTRVPGVWEASYRLSDGKHKANLVTQLTWPYVRQSFQKLVKENPCDLFVSVHPLANHSLLNITSHLNIPFITVVTDMVSAHAFWFDTRADLVIVATDEARKRGLRHGIRPEKIIVVGQPVAERFCAPKDDKAAIKKQLGWKTELPVVILVGGGEGMGPIEQIALAIDDANLPVSMAIITGRNQQLKTALELRPWRHPAYIYGFVKDMPEFMAAADVMLTKAGPGTINEAFLAGLPLILYSRLPGQEEGNVNYVVDNGAGVWAPEPKNVVNTLKEWIEHPDELAAISAASKSLGKPDAAREIARLLISRLFYPHRTRKLLPSEI